MTSRNQTYRHYLTDAEAADFRPHVGGTVSFPLSQHSEPSYFRIKTDSDDRVYLLRLPRVPSLTKVAQIGTDGVPREFRTPFRLVRAQKVLLVIAAAWTALMVGIEIGPAYELQSFGYGYVALPLPWFAFAAQFVWYTFWDLDPERATKVANTYFAASAAVRIHNVLQQHARPPQYTVLPPGSGKPDENGRRNPLEYG